MLKTVLIFVHLASFALSFGLVVFCDFMMLSVPIRGEISEQQLGLLKTCSKWIHLALFVLILSGLGFLVYYRLQMPAALLNPKLYVKMTVVMILSLNGFWLHRYGMRILERARTQNLLLPQNLASLRKLLMSGGLSAISWWSAFAMGTFKELNFVFSFRDLFSVYVLMVLGMLITVEAGLRSRGLIMSWLTFVAQEDSDTTKKLSGFEYLDLRKAGVRQVLELSRARESKNQA